MTTEATMGTIVSVVAAAAETQSPTGPTFGAMSSSSRTQNGREAMMGEDTAHSQTYGKV